MNASQARLIAVSLVAVAAGGALHAQGSTAPRAQSSAQTEQKSTTIVGCLVQGLPDSAASDRRSETAAANSNEYFIRTPTVKLPVGTSVAVGQPGSTSTATSVGTPAPDSFYRVTGLGAEQLRPHIGHRVELQGHLSGNTPGTESTRATTTQDKDGRATTRVESRIAIAGVLHATAIKMIEASCK
jgi:hypothetical protein